MPSYSYRCTNPECADEKTKEPYVFNVIQKMNETHEANCPKCGKPAQRIFDIGGIGFKGSGFHVNDYPR